jgi:hypothetical protein
VRTRTPAWLGWALWAVSLALTALTCLFTSLSSPPTGSVWEDQRWLFLAGTALLFSAPGGLIAIHRPANPIGWLLCAIGLIAGVAGAVGGYGGYSVDAPGRVVALWVASVLGLLILAPVPLLFLLFPDGRPPSRGWWSVAWLTVVAAFGLALGLALSPGPLGLGADPTNPPNPFGIAGAEDLMFQFFFLGAVLLLMAAALALAAVSDRFQRARGLERQQLKWFLYGAVVLIITLLFGLVPAMEGITALPALAGFGVFTTCVAVAILRHRLYDIDRLISRTVAYVLLTVALGLVYLAAVLLLRQVLDPLTGNSSLAVAASTLAVAALFHPARRRIQDTVDRRFNRRRYDAARMVEAFSARLRDEVDLDALTGEFLAVVEQTVAPTRASLWLRPLQRSEQPQASINRVLDST